jgi:hypothetical protein
MFYQGCLTEQGCFIKVVLQNKVVLSRLSYRTRMFLFMFYQGCLYRTIIHCSYMKAEASSKPQTTPNTKTTSKTKTKPQRQRQPQRHMGTPVRHMVEQSAQLFLRRDIVKVTSQSRCGTVLLQRYKL